MKAFVSSRLSEKWLSKVEDEFTDFEFYDWFNNGMLPQEEFAKKIAGCHVIVTESDNITTAMLEEAKNLFAIVDCRGTVINIDIETATKNGVIILNTPGRNADAVADLTVAMMVMASRNVLRGIDSLRKGLWVEKGRYWVYQNHQGYELPGKTIGLVGLGHIGQLVIKRLAGFDVNIIGYDPFVSHEQARQMGATKVELDEVFAQSDILSLHLPLNEKTKGIFGERELRLMKPTSFLINTSRAAVFNEKDLIQCLQEDRIGGAALDVFHKEPIDFSYPLCNLPNVICIPHLGGATHEVIDHQSRIGIGGLLEFMNGGQPGNIINPAAIEKSRVRLKTCKP